MKTKKRFDKKIRNDIFSSRANVANLREISSGTIANYKPGSRAGKGGERGEGGGEHALIVKSRSMTDAATAERVRDHRRTLIREKRNEVAGERG